MAEYIGQIPEEVDAPAAELEAKAGELEDLKTAIGAKLGGTTWTGPDRDRFQADWEGALSANVAMPWQYIDANSSASPARLPSLA